jgi:2-amino-4-hydroxy-6-hydroxymethyldihydropteridine diphosphokinase
LKGKTHRVWVGIGSNVEPLPHLQLAVAAMAERYGGLRQSSVYENPPVGFSGADFLNMVVGLDTADSWQQVTAFLESIHRQAGRSSGRQQFGPRKLDLDLLLFGVLVDPAARVPRADVLRYAFVLGPLAEVAPALCHPLGGMTMAAAWAAYAGPRALRNLGQLDGLK